jgi:chemotaxis regulatin CheY-phosphate phosphatase CheZ
MITRIIDETSPEYAAAIEELLVAFAYGDPTRVHNALGALGHGPEMHRVHSRVHEILASFHATLWQIRGDFDPATVTMSSTNIPDAIKKLESVLDETAQSTASVFTLLGKNEALIKQGEELLRKLEEEAKQNVLSQASLLDFVTAYRTLNHGMITVATEIVTTQEFQDLCGQRIQKVIRLVRDVESNLVKLLEQLKITIPQPPSTIPEGEQRVGQESVDDLLKDFGI